MGRVSVSAYRRRDGTPVSGYEYDRWRVAAEHTRAADALRGARLVDEQLVVSSLLTQMNPAEVRRFHDREQAAVDWAVDGIPLPLVHFLTTGEKTFVVGAAAALSGAVAFVGLPLLVAPIAGVLAAGFVVPPLRRWFAARKARRQFHEEHARPDRSEYVSEAEARAAQWRHWFGDVPPSSTRVEGFERRGSTFDVVSSVDVHGVGGVAWVERESRGGGTYEGDVLLYPGANLNELRFEFPVCVPGVNLRGAEMRDSVTQDGSVFDGADLRGANIEGSTWRGSLRYANLDGASLRRSNLSECDMEGVGLSGVDVTGAVLPEDLTTSNISRSQFDSLAGMGPNGSGLPYRIKEASMDDIAAGYGGDRDAAAIALWSGDVEVRSRTTNKVVTGEFDINEHYVPHWALADIRKVT